MNNFKSIIYDWQGQIIKTNGVKRVQEDLIFNSLVSKPIKVITGFRRTGKSFLVRQIANRAVNAGLYDLTDILFLNFENYELSEINTAKTLGQLFDFFITDVSNIQNKKLLILDEIQLVKGWDKFLRTIYEKNDNIEIIITGSNSELLSSEIGSHLSGRFIEFFVLPFSFKEFLIYRNKYPKSISDYYQNKTEINSFFNEFISYGGLPEVFTITDNHTKLSYLEGVLNKVILDDVVKRFHLDNVEILEQLTKYLLANTGSQISFAKITNHINFHWGNIKSSTLIKYAQYLVKAFALYEVNKFDWKQSKYFSQSRKFYAVDTGLLNLFRSENENYSFRMENLVFLELLRREQNIVFGMNQQGKEIDFLVENNNGTTKEKIQVCVDLNERNFKREISAFDVSDKYLKNYKNNLLTLNNSETVKSGNLIIDQINIIEWLLGL
jgi:uncharacterized protein